MYSKCTLVTDVQEVYTCNMYSTVRVQTSICCFIIRSLCVKNGYWIILYDRFLFNLIELRVDARLDSYCFDYTCIMINFYKSSILFI